MSDLLEYLTNWVGRQRSDLETNGLTVAIDVSAHDRENRSAWVDIDSADRLVRLTVWESGEATLSVGEVASGLLLADEQLQVSGVFGLEQALGAAVAWAQGRP
jgi:hypothetical protein